MEILKHVTIEEREGRDGRIRTKKRTEYAVVDDTELLASFATKREARAYIERFRRIASAE